MNDRSNIVLIGMPGAGKSTLGVVLAKILNKRFVDADLIIQQETGETLQHIIDTQGTDRFIKIENDVLCGIETKNTIIATGGSAIYSDEAMRHLRDIGVIVYLKISYESLVERLGDFDERGVVLKGGLAMSLRELFNERGPLYEQYAEHTVNIDDLNITSAARKVASLFR